MQNIINKVILVLLFFIFSLNAEDKIILQLKWLHQFQFAGYYAAKEKGFYKEVGLDVEIKQRNLTKDNIKQVLTNEADYGIADSILLLYKAKNKPVVLVSPIFQHSPSILISLKKSGIDSPYKLDKKNIIFYENNADGFAILSLLKKLKVKPNLIRKKQKDDYKKLLEENVDLIPAYLSNEPYYFKEKNIPINIINPSNYGFNLYGDMIFTTQKEAQNNPQRVKKFKEASLKGWKYALENKDEIIKLIINKYNSTKSYEHLMFEAQAIEKMISKDTIPLGTLDKGRLQYINELYKEYLLDDKDNDNFNYESFVFEDNDLNIYNFSKEELNYLKENPVIKVLNLDYFPPYNFNENNEAKGFIIDYLKGISNFINIKFEFIKTSTWNSFENMIKNKEIDVIPNIAITEERQKFLTYSNFNYISYIPAFVTKKGKIISNNLDELDNKIIAVTNNSFLHKILKKDYPNISLLLVSNTKKAIEMVLEEKADLALDNLSTLEYIIKDNWYTNLKTVKIVSSVIPSQVDLHIGYSKENFLLKSIIEKVNNQLSIGEINKLKEKWVEIKIDKNIINLSKDEKKYLNKKSEIKICIDPEWMPFEKIKDGKYIGMSADYVKIFEKKINKPFSLVTTKNWTETLNFLKQRKCDLTPIIFPQEEIKKYLDFSKPYIIFPLVLATRLDESFISDVPSTYGKKVGYIKNYAYANELKKKYPEIDLVEVESMKDGLEKVKNKEIFGLVGVLASIGYYIQKDYFGELKISGKFDETWSFSVGTRKDEPLLNSIINKTIDTISPNEHKKIYETWISVKYQESIDYKKIIIVSGVLLLIILIILYKNRTINNINKKMKKYINIIDKNVLTTTTDTEGNIIYVSNAFLRKSKYKKEDLIGKNHRIVKHEDTNKEIFIELWNTIKSGKEWKGEIKNRKKDGGYFWTNTVITPEFNSKGQIISYTAIREDITDKKIIEEISITDGLTNIYNRRHFDNIFEKYINNSKRNNEIVTFILMDIDYFKQYNDNYGHQKGDEVLKSVAKFLKTTVKRADDYCFRLGGEEFGIVFKAKDISKAKSFATKILKGIENLKIPHEYNSASKYITVSIGTSCYYATDITNTKELYKNTDELLYKSKEKGRNQISFNN